MSGSSKIVKWWECLTHELWEDLGLRIESFLNEITLAELVTKRNESVNLIVILTIC